MESAEYPHIGVEKASKCLECGNTNLIRDYKSGEFVCERCGTVVRSKILSYGPEWRSFNIEQREKRTRVGAPSTWTIHDKGLSTFIDWSGRDIYGKRLKLSGEPKSIVCVSGTVGPESPDPARGISL
jgi:transcription initiation factor TFIIB